MSEHVEQALAIAAAEAGAQKPVAPPHLLYGALSVVDCHVADALVQLGLNRETIFFSSEIIAGYTPDDAGEHGDSHSDETEAAIRKALAGVPSEFGIR